MKTIKLGDPMPDPCPHCGLLYGYQVSDKVRLYYSYFYLADGEHDGGAYSDYVNTTKKDTRASCLNCGKDLKLKVDRADD